MDETDRPSGECMTYKIFYFLEDDTVSVKELKENREGRDYFPMLLKRTKLPKNWKQRPGLLQFFNQIKVDKNIFL